MSSVRVAAAEQCSRTERVPHGRARASRVRLVVAVDPARVPRRRSMVCTASFATSADANCSDESAAPHSAQTLHKLLSSYISLPATASKLRRLKADELRSICGTAGIQAHGTKAVYVDAIMSTLAQSEHVMRVAPAGDDTNAAEAPVSAAQPDSPSSKMENGMDEEPSESSVWDVSYDSATEGDAFASTDGSEDYDSTQSSEGSIGEEDSIWGPGRDSSEISPDALARAQELMEAALAASSEPDNAFVDPFASTAEDARASWLHTAHSKALPRLQRFMRTRVQPHAAANPTGVAVTWLGTSSGAPTRTRNNSGISLRATAGDRDDIMLVDAGEGTLTQFQAVGLDLTRLASVCITHHHGDHCFGLPALVQARHELQLERSGEVTPLQVFGPPGTIDFVLASVRLDSMLPSAADAAPRQRVSITEWGLGSGPSEAPRTVVRGGIEFECARRNPDQAHGAPPAGVREVRQFAFCRRPGTVGRGEDTKFPVYMGLTWTVQLPNGWTIATAQLRHRVPCWGYVFLEPQGAEQQRRRKVCLLGDTCDSRAIQHLARGCDLLSHESTFLDSMRDKARTATHSTGRQAGEFAAAVRTRQLVLTHFSGRYQAAAVTPAVAPSAEDEEEQAASLSMLQREAEAALRGGPVACAFDGLTWRVARPGEPGGGVTEPWAVRTSLNRV
eukprot:jgi/Ulvmu1/10886/UM007_0062.1